MLANLKHNKTQQSLTLWRANDRDYQQLKNTVSYSSHSPTGEPRTAIVSRLRTQQDTAATHSLKNQGQTLLAALKYSKPQQPLTNWRAKEGIVNRLKTQ